MKIFITGGSGMLGQYLNIELSMKHQILTQYHSNIGNCGNFNNVKSSITNYRKLDEVFSTFKPEAVIHTAAVSNSEKANKLPCKCCLRYQCQRNCKACRTVLSIQLKVSIFVNRFSIRRLPRFNVTRRC